MRDNNTGELEIYQNLQLFFYYIFLFCFLLERKIFDSLKQVNPKGCGAVKARSVSKSLSEWHLLGFLTIDDNNLPNNINIEAGLIAPDGIDGRFFLVYQNYKNILYYNCSSYYAVAIGLLSDAIKN